MSAKKNKPLISKEDIAKNPDPKIDQDFEGYPHGPAKDETISPKTKKEHKIAGTDIKDGEKNNQVARKRKKMDEQD